MRNPLDLNNLPEDYEKQPHDVSSHASPAGSYRKQKNGEKDEISRRRKVYACRFCSLKFCKSQALGGHMNRHRQERETETLNRARQLVFGNDNAHHLSSSQPMVHGGYHYQAACTHMGRTPYPKRLFPGTSNAALPPLLPQYPDLSSRLGIINSSGTDLFTGYVCSGNPKFLLQNLSCTTTPPPDCTNNYTCIGAPVGQAFTDQ